MFVNFGEKEENFVLPIVSKIRQAGVRAELYPEAAKMKKQMSYADSKQIPFVAIVGESEMNEGKVNLKNMLSGEQELLTPDELIAKITL
ncbi:MAG: His/Gly/Thr/Pro-type tRNA ligase C-terminal domain-containing protein, partial [Tannerellaceae bacterium]